jgi:hypothetical protein
VPARFPFILAFACVLAGVLSGCIDPVGGFRESREAWRAEQNGEYHKAYELYCKAAAGNPGSRLIAMALDRTAPSAANYWEDRAHRAVDRGDYAEAWTLFMRVLDIRPDHPSAPHLIRRLERDHAQAVAKVKSTWMVLGSAALASAEPGRAGAPQVNQVRATRAVLAEPGREPSAPTADSTPKSIDRPMPSTVQRSEPEVVAAASAQDDMSSRSLAEGGSSAPGRTANGNMIYPSKDDTRAPARAAVQPSAGTSSRADDLGQLQRQLDAAAARTRARQESRVAQAPPPRAPERLVVPTPPPAVPVRPPPIFEAQSQPPSDTRPSVDRVEAAPPAVRQEQTASVQEHSAPASDRGSAFQFMVVRTLSKKDSRFPKKAEIVDGLIVELRDTDDDPKADFSVYSGSKHGTKLKGLKIGESHVVVGRSGRVYELIVLSIIDKRQTVRLGVRAAPEPGSR